MSRSRLSRSATTAAAGLCRETRRGTAASFEPAIAPRLSSPQRRQMGCLDEQTVVAFVGGGLTGEALAAVERHLLACADCTTLVALAAPAPGAAGASRTHSHRPGRHRGAARRAEPAGPGSAVGRYRLLHLVGRGGMGEVYAAYDPELDRKVAIKLLRARHLSPTRSNAARLLREAQAMARLSHPNVVTVYDVGDGRRPAVPRDGAGRGRDAGRVAGRRAGARAPRSSRVREAGRGLAAAHAPRLVHRDFKPENVMVGADGTSRVMDFGLAALGQARDEPRLTRIGSILGTPLYMAPEQLRGQPVDARADQFSFCVALYEALYGERPFAGENFPQLRTAVLGGRVRPAPLASGVPRRLRAVLLRGLSVDRAHRFPDMDTLVDAIEAAATGGPRLAPLLAGAGAAAVLVLAGGLVWQLRADAARDDMRRNAGEAGGRVAEAPGRRAAGRRSRRLSRLDGARRARTPCPHQSGAGRVRRRVAQRPPRGLRGGPGAPRAARVAGHPRSLPRPARRGAWRPGRRARARRREDRPQVDRRRRSRSRRRRRAPTPARRRPSPRRPTTPPPRARCSSCAGGWPRCARWPRRGTTGKR